MKDQGKWDDACDLLVFGSGAAGLTAALVGMKQGLKTIVCESTEYFGGTTAYSAGSIWIPGSPPILRNGREEQSETVWTYLRSVIGDSLDEPLMRAFLEAGPEAIAFLERESDVKFQHNPNPDYHPALPGGSAYGRNMVPIPLDGRLLGDWFGRLRPPRSIYMVLGGMMVGRRDVQILLRPWSSWSALRQAVTMVGSHLLSRLTHPRGTRLLIGNALIARYLLSLKRLNADLRERHELVELLRSGDQVVGAVVRTPVGVKRFRADAVVLATGGVPHDASAKELWMKEFPHQLSTAAESNVGTGVRAAMAIGADVRKDVDSPAWWSPASVLKHPDGTRTIWMHSHMDRGKPGLIAVNSAGRRFVNEADSYHSFVMAMFRSHKLTQTIPAWLVCDHGFIRRYGLGLVRPVIGRIDRFVRLGYLQHANSIEELAKKMGVSADGLEKTVARHNADALRGKDTEFGRGSNALNTFNGDADQYPNPCLRPIQKPPFYGVAVYPNSIGTMVGLKTDVDSRVLDANDRPIEGLYACGNDMSSVMRGYYPGPGVTIGPGITFAYRAARCIERVKAERDQKFASMSGASGEHSVTQESAHEHA